MGCWSRNIHRGLTGSCIYVIFNCSWLSHVWEVERYHICRLGNIETPSISWPYGLFIEQIWPTCPFHYGLSSQIYTQSFLLFFFKKDLWISLDKQTLTHSGYHFILLDIGIFQTRSKACREEPGLNYGLGNIRCLLLCHLPCLVFVRIFHLNSSKYSMTLRRRQYLISQVL